MSVTTKEQSARSRLLATFEVNGRLFGMDADGVQEVVRLGSLTPVGHAAGEVSGIMNLRGRIVTILDTRRLLGVGGSDRDCGGFIFIVENKSEFIGLLVNKAGDVVEMERGGMEPAPSNVPRAQARFIKGVFRSGERVLTVLDADQLVAGGAE